MSKKLTIRNSCTVCKVGNSGLAFFAPEHSQNDILYWLLCLELFLYQRVSMFSLYGPVFSNQTCYRKPMFCSIAKILFFTKTCFFIHITYFFVLFSHQKFDDRPLIKPGAFILDCYHFEQPQNRYFLWD